MTAPAAPVSSASGQTRSGVAVGAVKVFELSLGQMLWSRRTLLMVLVVGVPVLLAIVLRGLTESGVPVTRVGRDTLSGPALFGLMMWAFYIKFAVPVLAIFYGTALIADEVEDKTLTYLFTRPLRREAVFLGKYLAYLVCTIGVVLPSVVFVWLLVVPVRGSLGESFPDLVSDLGILSAGLAVYGALFGLVGATFKRPLVFGLLFVFGWENLALSLPGYLNRLTVAFYLQGLVPHTMPSDSPLMVMQALFRDVPSLPEGLLGLGLIGALGLWGATRAVANREYVLEQ